MKTIIYLPIDAPLGNADQFEGKPTYDRDAAIRQARTMWDHLTRREKEQRHVYVGVFRAEAEPGVPAEEVYNDATMDGTWCNDHDVIEVTEEA